MTTLPPPELRLLDAIVTRWVWLTATKVDVGRWWRPARLWAAGTDTELILVAAGPRPVVVRVPLTALHASLYNAVTGEVILAPAPGVPYRSLKLPPVEGRQLLEQIKQKETSAC